MTNQEVANIVINEGLDHAILHYVSSDEIDDPILKEKWKEADKLLSEIDSMLSDLYKNDEEQV